MANKLDISNASATVVQPIKAETINFLQNAWSGALKDLIIALVGGYTGGYNAGAAYIIYGCQLTAQSGNSYTYGAGAIFFNGEVFEFTGGTVVLSAGQVIVMNLNTAYDTNNADPTTFSDQLQYNVHQIRTIAITNGATGSGTIGDLTGAGSILKQTNLSMSIINTALVSNEFAISNETIRAEWVEGNLQNQLNVLGANWQQLTSFSLGNVGGAISSLASAQLNWVIIGKTMTLSWYFTLTTASSVVSITIPIPGGAAIAAGYNGSAMAYAYAGDNGVCKASAYASDNTGVIRLQQASATGNFSDQTAKEFSGTITFQIA